MVKAAFLGIFVPPICEFLMNAVMPHSQVHFKNVSCCTTVSSCISVASCDFGAEWLLGGTVLYGILLFHKRLVKHLEKYQGLEILHMSNQFQKNSNVVSNGKTTNSAMRNLLPFVCPGFWSLNPLNIIDKEKLAN